MRPFRRPDSSSSFGPIRWQRHGRPSSPQSRPLLHPHRDQGGVCRADEGARELRAQSIGGISSSMTGLTEVRSLRVEVIRQLFLAALGKPPFSYQEAILSHSGPLVISKARQTGISTAMACMAVSYAALGNRKVLICSNKEDSAKHILEYADLFIRPFLEAALISKPVTDELGLVQWKEGGEIRCFAANPSGARGFPAHLVIFDEFGHFTKEIDMDRRMLEAVAPSISQLGGRLILLSTPNGSKNEFYRQWEATPEHNRMTIHYTQCPTLKVHEETLPFGKQYWIQGIPSPFPESSFRQEFCNDFFVGSDEAIPVDALRAAMFPGETFPSLSAYVIGVYIGREHDQTAFVVIGKTDGEDLIWVREVQALYRTPFPQQMAVLRELVARYSPVRIVMDRTYNTQSTEDAQREFPGLVEPFVFGAQSKLDLIAAASAHFTAGKVRCPSRNRQAIDEIANIRKVVSPAGGIQYKDSPHGDIGWACLLALWGIPKTQEIHAIFSDAW